MSTRACFKYKDISMDEAQILQLFHREASTSVGVNYYTTQKQYLLEKVKEQGWYATVNSLAVWFSTNNLEAVDNALMQYLAGNK